jgi:uncharacterized membrane protein
MNKTFVVLICALALLLVPTLASAVNIEITDLKVDGFSLNPANGHADNLQVERGADMQIKVRLRALADVSDAQVEADIYGYRYSKYEEDKVSDTTSTFDLRENNTVIKTLSLQIPTKIDKDYFKLRVRVADRDGVSYEQVYEIQVVGIAPENAVYVRDFSFSPDQIIAGRAFTATVKVKNIGDDDMNDLKVTVSVPELNIKDAEYLDSLDADDSKTFEKLLLRVPECTKPGQYDVDIKVEFDEYESSETTGTITVLADQACTAQTTPGGSSGSEGKTIVRIPQSQDVAPGQTAVFPVVIENLKSTPQTYVLSVSGIGFGTSRIDPAPLLVIKSGESKTAYVYVTVNAQEAAGDKVFAITVDSGDDSKQIPVTAKVTGTQTQAGQTGAVSMDGLRRGLEVGLVILVIVLIIIGLIVGFTKLKDQKKPATNESEPYY